MNATQIEAVSKLAVRDGATKANLSDLKTVGAMSVSDGFAAEGDIVEFPPVISNIESRDIPGGTRKAYSVAALVNGQPAMFGLANVRKMVNVQKSGRPHLCPSSKKWHDEAGLTEASFDEQRVLALGGKTLKCVDFITLPRRDFASKQIREATVAVYEVQ